MTKPYQKVFVSILLVLLVAGIVGCNNQAKDVKVIAEYEGGQVTEDEFNTYISVIQFFNPQITEAVQQPEAKKQILEKYIGEKYLSKLQKGNQSNIDNAKNILEIIKNQTIQTLGSEDKYKEQLTALNITEDDIFNYLSRYYAIQSHFVEKKYSENKEQFTIATVSHILVKMDEERTDEEAKKRAEVVLAKLKDGEDFAALAKEYSDDPGSKDNGGTYENVAVSLWVPEFKEAALTLPINEISNLVKTQFGYHIITVSERHIPNIEDISEEVKARVTNEEYNKFITNDLPSIINKINL